MLGDVRADAAGADTLLAAMAFGRMTERDVGPDWAGTREGNTVRVVVLKVCDDAEGAGVREL